jgi:hypothetical protein
MSAEIFTSKSAYYAIKYTLLFQIQISHLLVQLCTVSTPVPQECTKKEELKSVLYSSLASCVPRSAVK